MSKNVMKILTLLMAVVMIAACFAACGSDPSSEEPATDEPAAEAAADTDAAAEEDTAAAGFTEIPIFEDEELGFINLSAVYFQPVPMSDGTKAEDYDIHLEADISALENNFGYELGSWIPYLTVDYKVEQNGEEKAAGTFMEMAASDGPHYGANIKLPEAGTYSLTITIHSPADNNYLLHTDELTGPGAKSFDEAFPDGVITYTYDSWDYLGPQSAE